MTAASGLAILANAPDPSPTATKQYLALAERSVRSLISTKRWVFALVAPLIFTLGYYLPIRWIMSQTNPELNYAQFILPIIVLQTASFSMMTGAQLAAQEMESGLNDRLGTMPVARLAPMFGNLVSGQIQAIIGIAAAIGYGHIIGFRFQGSLLATVLFIAIALLTTLVLGIAADLLGTWARNPASVGQVLALPTLIFGMLSCGFIPESGFPEWIRPFVRNQPISQLSFALRDLSVGTIDLNVLFPALAWVVGAFVLFLPLAVKVRSQRR